MEYIDTHTHLYDAAFAGEEDEAAGRAEAAGVSKMILPDIDSTTREKMFGLAARHPGKFFPCLALHPTSIGADWKEECDKMLSQRQRKDITAIGETGLDFYWSKEFADSQKEIFRMHLDLSLEMKLPVIIHSREATEAVFDILEGYRGRGLRGVFHAFSGSTETFRRLEKYGDWYVGIGGVLTFRNASIAETVKKIPMERIVSETDSPYLTPVPFRGRRNESAYIPYIIKKLAELKSADEDETARTAVSNATNLFNL